MPPNPALARTVRTLCEFYGTDAVLYVAQEILLEEEGPQRRPGAREVAEKLRADLESWPPAFRRSVEPRIADVAECDSEHAGRWARNWLDQIERSREDPHGTHQDRCSCGCLGLNDRLRYSLQAIRESARKIREAPTARIRSNRRRDLADAKSRLLTVLWERGVQRIDRLQLAQHAVDSAKARQEELGTEIDREEWEAARLTERLSPGYRYLRGPRKGQLLSAGDRERDQARLRLRQDSIRGKRQRILELGEMMTWNVPRLVRDFTGCLRDSVALSVEG